MGYGSIYVSDDFLEELKKIVPRGVPYYIFLQCLVNEYKGFPEDKQKTIRLLSKETFLHNRKARLKTRRKLFEKG